MKRLIFTLILAAICSISSFAYNFSAVSDGHTLYYNITSSTLPYTVEVTSQNSSSPYYSTYPTGRLTIPSSVTYNGKTYSVTSIGNHAFYGCSELIGTLNLPSSVSSIGSSAFYNCTGLQTLSAGGNVQTIGNNAFYNVRNITGTGSATGSPWGALTVIGHVDGCLVYADSRKKILTGCISTATTITIPNSVTSISGRAFSGCNRLTTVNFNATNCTSNGASWNDCTSLINLNIGENVTNIPANAFSGCNGLTGALTIPNSVTSIGNSAFSNCTGLSSVTIPNSVTSIGSGAFAVCSGLTSITIPNSVTSIGNYAFHNCTGLTTVNFNAPNCTTMGSSDNPVFNNCTSLSTLNIGENVTNIPDYAFKNSGLTSVTIPYFVTSIGKVAFGNCTGLTTVNFNAPNCTTMGSQLSPVFSGCTSLSTLNIGENVTNIPDFAFEDCSGLPSVTIPNSVTRIGKDAFRYCSGLTAVYYTGSIAEWCQITFDLLNFGSNPLCYAHNLYINNELVTDLVIPDGVTTINPAAFAGASIISVTIPNSVTSIYQYAFSNCTGLSSVTIPNSVTYIGYNAFYCNLTDIYATPTIPPDCHLYAFKNFSATLWVPCGFAEIYGTERTWYHFSDIREAQLNELVVVSSANQQQGRARVSQQPDCADGIAIIEAIPNRGYAFSQWNDGNTDNPRTITITEDVEYTASFVALPSYTITVLSADETMGTVDGGGIYYEGETATLTATPLDGYGFVGWRDDNTDNPRTITVTEDASYTASFGVLYTITVLSDDETIGSASGSGSYAEGAQSEISANAIEHYHFVQWNDGNTDNPSTITITGDATYIATFAIDQHIITLESNNVAMGTVSDGGTYDYGTEIQISATAAEHYHFVEWNDGNTDNPRTITVTGDATYTATFAIDRFAITVESNDETMGTASESGEYDYGTEMQISATPADHYHFVQWNDGSTDNPRTITVTSDSTFTATFAIDQHTITVESNSEAMGSVSEGGTYDYGTEIQISATANEGYGFAAWNDGNTDNPRTIVVTEDITYTATFDVLRSISVVSTDETMGTVQGTGEYIEGTTVQITAIPNEHYHFVHWIDEENPTRDFNTDNPRTITVTGNMTYTAVFAIDQHTITVESDDTGMGTVSESGTYDYGTEIQISASARDGYQFVSWNDGNTDNPRTITVVADATYIASFVSVTGIEKTAAFEIALFPNPATDILNITSSETISEIEIVNTLGQVVYRTDVNADNAVCDVNGLANGVYVVKIYGNPRTSTGSASGIVQKFIKE